MSTTIGDILDNFFAPWSKEKLWIMGPADNYTKVVRKWNPVIQAVKKIKEDVKKNCAAWQTNHASTPGWKPKISANFTPDPKGKRFPVASPPGTDPATCKKAFVIYVSSKAASKARYFSPIPLPPIPEVQTRNLYTCSIGSFTLVATVDAVNCGNASVSTAGKTRGPRSATIKLWMYNAMTRQSFGRFANDPVFSQSGMKAQYMWWYWTENHSW